MEKSLNFIPHFQYEPCCDSTAVEDKAFQSLTTHTVVYATHFFKLPKSHYSPVFDIQKNTRQLSFTTAFSIEHTIRYVL